MAGTGLTGGTINSVGTIAVNVGTGASQIPQLNGSAQLALNKGSAGAPTYSFVNDALSGLLSANPGTIALATAGTSRLTIDNLGNVGLGTTSPAGALDVETSGSGGGIAALFMQPGQTSGYDYLKLGKSQTNNNEADIAFNYVGNNSTSNTLGFGFYGNSLVMNILASGNVGIGTTSPGGALDVTATGTGSSFIIVPRDTTAGRPVAAASVNGSIRYNTNTNAFEFFQNGVWANYNTGAGGGVTWPLTASPNTAAPGAPQYTFGSSTTTGVYSPGTTTLGFTTNGVEAMRIDAAGHVGIGTTNPAAILDVEGTGSVNLNTGTLNVASNVAITGTTVHSFQQNSQTSTTLIGASLSAWPAGSGGASFWRRKPLQYLH